MEASNIASLPQRTIVPAGIQISNNVIYLCGKACFNVTAAVTLAIVIETGLIKGLATVRQLPSAILCLPILFNEPNKDTKAK